MSAATTAADPILAAAEAAMLRPWVWGESDCCAAACAAFAALHGVDPMEPLRGRYLSRDEALVMIARRGGWARMTEDLALAAGLVPVDPAAAPPGAIGLHGRSDDPAVHALVLHLGEGQWAGKSARGIMVIGDAIRAAWVLP